MIKDAFDVYSFRYRNRLNTDFKINENMPTFNTKTKVRNLKMKSLFVVLGFLFLLTSSFLSLMTLPGMSPLVNRTVKDTFLHHLERKAKKLTQAEKLISLSQTIGNIERARNKI